MKRLSEEHHTRKFPKPAVIIIMVFFCIVLATSIYFFLQNRWQNVQIASLSQDNRELSLKASKSTKELLDLKNQDQYKINQRLSADINSVKKTYKDSISSYESILDLRAQNQKTDTLEKQYVDVVRFLSEDNYASAEAILSDLNRQIDKAQQTVAKAQAPQNNIPLSDTLPTNGFNQQQVKTDGGTFTVDLVAADLNTTKVIVDTASLSDCSDNCPVLPLENYVTRNSAYAGINGTFFCPASYPSCVGKTNSFDTLLMNKDKIYFNSLNNVYSTVPAIIINGTSVRFVTQSLQWGRDTGVDMVLAMQPLLIFGNNIVYNGSSDSKYNSKTTRGFIGNVGSTVYIGFVFGASMQDSANVLHTLGMENALNLDEGGSAALWFNGYYKVGPGRDIPNAILFLRK